MEGYADRLSVLMDLEEFVVISVAEDQGLRPSEVEKWFAESETYKKLYMANSTYYTVGFTNIYADFMVELMRDKKIDTNN